MIVTYSSLMFQISSDEWEKPLHLLTVSIYDYCFLSWVSDGRYLDVFFATKLVGSGLKLLFSLGHY